MCAVWLILRSEAFVLKEIDDDTIHAHLLLLNKRTNYLNRERYGKEGKRCRNMNISINTRMNICIDGCTDRYIKRIVSN